VLAVPEEAVQTVEGGPAVFVPVEGEENTFAKRAITVGPAIGGVRPITSGLKEGDRIVVSGTFILKAELGKGEASHEH
jgi:cobalt-zinc-cadmium efflux system membrane fusion protein